MTNDYEYQLLKKAQERLVLARKIENRDCDIFDHPQFNAIEELAKEMSSGINVQVNNLVKAMIDSEPCLFNNSSDNLMPVNQKENQ